MSVTGTPPSVARQSARTCSSTPGTRPSRAATSGRNRAVAPPGSCQPPHPVRKIRLWPANDLFPLHHVWPPSDAKDEVATLAEAHVRFREFRFLEDVRHVHLRCPQLLAAVGRHPAGAWVVGPMRAHWFRSSMSIGQPEGWLAPGHIVDYPHDMLGGPLRADNGHAAQSPCTAGPRLRPRLASDRPGTRRIRPVRWRNASRSGQ